VTGLRLIGYWRNGEHPNYPDPRDFVDPDWDEDERHITGMYFATGTIARTFMGYSPCRICGENNGDLEYTDGVYMWPSGLAHYVHDHSVRLPEPITAHAVEQLAAIEARGLDLDWWLAATTT